MLKSWQFWLLTALGAAALGLTGLNVWYYDLNRSAQAAVSARAEYLQQTGPIRNLYTEMAKALAELAVKNHDAQVESMLSSEGIRLSQPANGGAAGPGAEKP